MRIVRLLILINIAVFAAWYYKGQTRFMTENFLVSWDSLQAGRWWTLITAVFSHNMIFHILINMIVLRDFGGFLEDVLGSRFFLIFYLIAGAFSSFCHAAVSNYLLHEPHLPALGASGAISGLVLLFSLIFRRRKILLFAIIPLPALMGALVFIGLDLWGLFAQYEGGGLPIGHGAHLGGALAGIICYFLVIRPNMKAGREV